MTYLFEGYEIFFFPVKVFDDILKKLLFDR